MATARKGEKGGEAVKFGPGEDRGVGGTHGSPKTRIKESGLPGRKSTKARRFKFQPIECRAICVAFELKGGKVTLEGKKKVTIMAVLAVPHQIQWFGERVYSGGVFSIPGKARSRRSHVDRGGRESDGLCIE